MARRTPGGVAWCVLTARPSLVDATCDMHRHHGAADALLALAESHVDRWPTHIRDELMQRALSHQRAYDVARAAYLAAGGEMSNAEKLNASAVAVLHLSDTIDGARDALDNAIEHGTAEQMDAARERLDAAIAAARVSK
mgnify:CR=1 FL=1